MPKASAPKAPCVAVWLSPHTIVMPGRVKPCSGPMMWTMPWRHVEFVEILDAEVLRAFSASASICASLSGSGCRRAVGGRHVVVDDGERLLRRAHLAARHAQALERLRARHLVDEVAVDIEQAGAVGLLVDHMVVPDLVVEGRGFMSLISAASRLSSLDLRATRACGQAARPSTADYPGPTTPPPRFLRRLGRRCGPSRQRPALSALIISVLFLRRHGVLPACGSQRYHAADLAAPYVNACRQTTCARDQSR